VVAIAAEEEEAFCPNGETTGLAGGAAGKTLSRCNGGTLVLTLLLVELLRGNEKMAGDRWTGVPVVLLVALFAVLELVLLVWLPVPLVVPLE